MQHASKLFPLITLLLLPLTAPAAYEGRVAWNPDPEAAARAAAKAGRPFFIWIHHDT